MRLKLTLLLLSFVCSSFCFAGEGSDSDSADKSGGKWSVGLFTAMSESEYVGDDSRVLPIPFITYFSERFYFSGLEAGYALFGDRELALFAIASGRIDYYQENDSYIFDGMGDRNPSMDMGLKLSYNNDLYSLNCGAKGDVLGVSNGYELFAEVEKKFSKAFGFEKLDVKLSGGLQWRSGQLNDYYYGVESQYAVVGRDQYEAGAGMNYNTGIGFQYQLDENWSIINGYEAKFLSDEIKDSPLVDKDVTLSASIGFLYSF